MADRFSLLDFAYAHRGLWSPTTFPENSLEAILAAAEAGYGCELDVRPAACGTPVVFHDGDLHRMTGRAGTTASVSAAELSALPLQGGGNLPTLESVLSAWPRKAPLLIELKIDGETDPVLFARTVSEMVAAHSGPAAMMSFDKAAVSAMPRDMMRGALILPSLLDDEITLEGAIGNALEAQPDYLACHVTDAPLAIALADDAGLPVAIWTVASPEVAGMIAGLRVALIFEGFHPAFDRP